MEKVPKIGVPTYTKIDANRVKRRRIVEDEIILRGGTMCLENQIKDATARLKALRSEHDACIDCACSPCVTRADELLAEIEDALESETELKAEWERATGKDYPKG